MSDGRRTWEETIEGAGVRVEAEVRRVIGYMNDEVVPEVRRNGSKALRAAAAELDRLAQLMEERTPPGSPSAAGGDER